MKVWIGIDNGTTGSIGIISDDGDVDFFLTPSNLGQDYTKTKKNISRIDWFKLKEKLKLYSPSKELSVLALIERPMVNPTRFNVSGVALRALESTLIILEDLQIPYVFIDSKEWQREILPKGVKGSEELKKASLDIGKRLFPSFQSIKHKDRDGLLIAEYARRNRL